MRRIVFVAIVVALVCAGASFAQRGPFVRDGEPQGPVVTPDVQARLAEIRAEIKANGFDYEVGPNEMMSYPIWQITGRNEELLTAEAYMHENMNGDVEALTAVDNATLPAKYIGVFTGVKDQAQCGSCWAFGITDAVETAVLWKTYPNGCGTATLTSITPCSGGPDLAEQYVLSCAKNYGYSYSCNGGNVDALGMLTASKSGGHIPESCFPYTATNAACSPKCTTPRTPITSWAYLTSDSTIPTDTAIKQAIMAHGAVAAYIYVDNAFQGYKSGVFQTSKKYRYTNHAIQLVGWDDSLGAWLLKNSWGTNTGWGIKGYMWVKYGTNRVGEGAAFAVAQ